MMARAKTTATLTFGAALTLNETESRALDALVGYGDDAFIEHFKAKLGQAYIRDHESGLKSFFSAVRRDVLPALRAIGEARRDLEGAARKRYDDKVLDAEWVCPICDAGPGNNSACRCADEVKW